MEAVADRNKLLAGEMKEELERVKVENKELQVMLHMMKHNYDKLRDRVEKITREMDEPIERASVEIRKPKAQQTTERSDKDNRSTTVKDGYKWRKYGQKLTKDSPFPRSYFRCAMAPACAARKKVQRRMDDTSLLMATYEGQHNHPPPGIYDTRIPSIGSSGSEPNCTIPLDLTLSWSNQERVMQSESSTQDETNGSSESTLEEYLELLKAEPHFRAVLATKIAHTMLEAHVRHS